MHACIHTYTYIHTCMHAYIHIHTYIHRYTHRHTHRYIHTLHYITSHHITLHHITLHYIHTNSHTHIIYIYVTHADPQCFQIVDADLETVSVAPQIWTAGYRMEPEHEGGQLFCEWVPRCSEFSFSGFPSTDIFQAKWRPEFPPPFRSESWASAPFGLIFLYGSTPLKYHGFDTKANGCTLDAHHFRNTPSVQQSLEVPIFRVDMIFLRNPMKHDMNFLITEDVPEKKEISIPHQ